MRVMIVSKTRMYNNSCVGGIDCDTFRSLRLLLPGNLQQPLNTEYNIGQVWEIEYVPRNEVVPPHIEDVVAGQGRLLGDATNFREFVSAHDKQWRGNPNQLFDGCIGFTGNGSGYICERLEVPSRSTGYWLPDQPLYMVAANNKVRYHYGRPEALTALPYVGFVPGIPIIPANTMVRVSLARWWRPQDQPDFEERCYVQLSGWYL